MNNYRQIWTSAEGAGYRRGMYDRQRAGGRNPLTDNPDVGEIAAEIRKHAPRSVLEVGCGWGRLLTGLQGEFELEGCDVSREMLVHCPPHLDVFEWDICSNEAIARDYDVIFSRGVFMYFNDQECLRAMRNLSSMAGQAVLIWEWSHVCERMRRAFDNTMFQFHPIEVKDE
jgi:trans-aconitate methyltransferase